MAHLDTARAGTVLDHLGKWTCQRPVCTSHVREAAVATLRRAAVEPKREATCAEEACKDTVRRHSASWRCCCCCWCAATPRLDVHLTRCRRGFRRSRGRRRRRRRRRQCLERGWRDCGAASAVASLHSTQRDVAKVAQHSAAMLGCDRLGMELNSPQRLRRVAHLKKVKLRRIQSYET